MLQPWRNNNRVFLLVNAQDASSLLRLWLLNGLRHDLGSWRQWLSLLLFTALTHERRKLLLHLYLTDCAGLRGVRLQLVREAVVGEHTLSHVLCELQRESILAQLPVLIIAVQLLLQF